MENADTLNQFIIQFAQNYPIISSILMIIGTLRFFFKPTMLLIETYVKQSESKNDDILLAKLLGSKVYITIVWFIDYFGSIKLPMPKK